MTAASPLTTLAHWIQSDDLLRMPPDRFDRVKQHIVDTVGATLAGYEALIRFGVAIDGPNALHRGVADARGGGERFGFGRGIGITADEPPILARENDTPIVPGMCLVLTAAATVGDGLVLHADSIII